MSYKFKKNKKLGIKGILRLLGVFLIVIGTVFAGTSLLSTGVTGNLYVGDECDGVNLANLENDLTTLSQTYINNCKFSGDNAGFTSNLRNRSQLDINIGIGGTALNRWIDYKLTDHLVMCNWVGFLDFADNTQLITDLDGNGEFGNPSDLVENGKSFNVNLEGNFEDNLCHFTWVAPIAPNQLLMSGDYGIQGTVTFNSMLLQNIPPSAIITPVVEEENNLLFLGLGSILSGGVFFGYSFLGKKKRWKR